MADLLERDHLDKRMPGDHLDLRTFSRTTLDHLVETLVDHLVLAGDLLVDGVVEEDFVVALHRDLCVVDPEVLAHL